MAKKQEIKLFEDKKVRTVWDDEKEKWFFCVVDVVEALTDSKDCVFRRYPFTNSGDIRSLGW